MSSTNRGRDRNKDDFYETPAWCVDALMQSPFGRDIQKLHGYWLEPCAGNGAIIKAIKHPHWHTVELRHESDIHDMYTVPFWCADFLTWQPPEDVSYNLCMTNPPFSLALEVVQKALTLAPVVVMLLRLNWIELTQKRERFLRQTSHQIDIGVIPHRASFDFHNTDSCAYAWFMWGLGGGRWELLPTPESYWSTKKNGKRN